MIVQILSMNLAGGNDVLSCQWPVTSAVTLAMFQREIFFTFEMKSHGKTPEARTCVAN